jgi:hypothetical protein
MKVIGLALTIMALAGTAFGTIALHLHVGAGLQSAWGFTMGMVWVLLAWAVFAND